MTKSPADFIIALQAKLRPECHVYLRHHARACWTAGIDTDGNSFPHWVEFAGATPAAAVEQLRGYIRGRVPDHARNQRKPAVFLREVKP